MSQQFKDVTFSLKRGEVSDPVQIDKHIYIIKLLDLIPPQHANFADYESSVRDDLYKETMVAAINAQRRSLGQMAVDSIQITDPILRQQWDDRYAKKTEQLQDLKDIRQKMDEQHAARGDSARWRGSIDAVDV